MPAPVNADELLELVKKSGVVEEPKLQAYVQKLTASYGLPKDPSKLAGLLVRDAVITYFQAEQLLQGKYKRFTIGKYKVLEKLGSGGMGQVFLCEHKLMRRRVAVKVLPTAKAEDRSSLDRFYREARAVAAVDHPNIVRAYDIDQDENLHFLVMEYVDGTNLQDLVKKVGPLDVTRASHYIYGASVGLQHAHEIGLVHRDIKPGNILIDRSGVVKILDMGLARFFHDEEDNLTRQNDENVLGTADYLAPEQALDSHTVDIRADLYSLGATFYFLLSGSAPFPDGSVAQKLIWHQNRAPRPIKSLRADIPDELVALIERMMMKEPARRFQSPSQVMAALAKWVATPIPPPTEREMPNISPAAGGSRAPATMVGPAGGKGGVRTNGSAEAPTIIASGAAPIVTPPPINPHSDVTTPGPVVWETLDSGTQTLSLGDGDTDRPGPERSRPTRGVPAHTGKRIRLYALVGVGILVLAAGIYFAFIRKPKPTVDVGPHSSNSRKIVVSKNGGENSVATLRDALSKAGPGDTISIVEPKLTEPSLSLKRVQHKDVTIESADGRPVVIEPLGMPTTMLDATDVEGLRIKNLEFDGNGNAEFGVQMSGTAPGAVLEGVTVRRVKNTGIKLTNLTGNAAHPVLINRCRVVLTGPTQTGVLVFAAGADTNRVTIRNLRVECQADSGSGTGFRIEGGATELEIENSRFYNLDNGGWFAKPPSAKVVKVKIARNTFYRMKSGLTFDLSPPLPSDPPDGTFELTIERNYFTKTAMIGQGLMGAGPLPGVLKVADNAYGPESIQGNIPITVSPLETPLLPNPDPANDATFLRFQKSTPAEIGPNKVSVGAP